MHIAVRIAAVAAFLGLGACGSNPGTSVNAAQAIEADAATDAEHLEDLAANTSNALLADRLENRADAIESSAENRANAIAAQDQPPADVDEDDND